jgi:hypothetical protein
MVRYIVHGIGKTSAVGKNRDYNGAEENKTGGKSGGNGVGKKPYFFLSEVGEHTLNSDMIC